MAGFKSFDEIIKASSNLNRAHYSTIERGSLTHVSGKPYSSFISANGGSPEPGQFPDELGVTSKQIALYNKNSKGAMQIVTPSNGRKLFLLGMVFFTSGQTDAEVTLIDRIASYDNCAFGVNNILTNPTPIGRNTSGVGNRIMCEYTEAIGAGSSTIRVKYKNASNVSKQTTFTATLDPSVTFPRIGTQSYFCPMADDDSVKAIEEVEILGTIATGKVCVSIVKPIFSMQAIRTATTIDKFIPSMPEIENDSYLQFIYKVQSSTTFSPRFDIYTIEG